MQKRLNKVIGLCLLECNLFLFDSPERLFNYSAFFSLRRQTKAVQYFIYVGGLPGCRRQEAYSTTSSSFAQKGFPTPQSSAAEQCLFQKHNDGEPEKAAGDVTLVSVTRRCPLGELSSITVWHPVTAVVQGFPPVFFSFCPATADPGSAYAHLIPVPSF